MKRFTSWLRRLMANSPRHGFKQNESSRASSRRRSTRPFLESLEDRFAPSVTRCDVTFVNNSGFPLVYQSSHLTEGDATASPPARIEMGGTASFGTESNGGAIPEGTEADVTYELQGTSITVKVHWDVPLVGDNHVDETDLTSQGFQTTGTIPSAGDHVDASFAINILDNTLTGASTGDGIPDVWKTGGIPEGNGSFYPLPGATVGHKDLYIEADAMSGFAPLPLPGITGVSNPAAGAGPIVVTTAAPNGLTTGTRITIGGVSLDGSTSNAVNANFTVTRLNSTQFSLDGTTSGVGDYTSGGTWSLTDIANADSFFPSLATAPLATGTNLDLVVNAFLNSPVSNPDGHTGIFLHIEDDASGLDGQIPVAPWSTLDGNGWPAGFTTIQQNTSPTVAGGFGSPAERGSANPTALLAAKALVYRYVIFGQSYGTTGSSGLSDLPGPDFMVTLGTFPLDAETQAGTFMHELGHTLGLGHGGEVPAMVGTTSTNTTTHTTIITGLSSTAQLFVGMGVSGPNLPGGYDTIASVDSLTQVTLKNAGGADASETLYFHDDENYKPNYQSIMNYEWQIPWSAPAGSPANQIAFNASWQLNYSTIAFPSINENNGINESAGIGGFAGLTEGILPQFNSKNQLTGYAQFVPETGPVDWNSINGSAESGYSLDLNGDGADTTLYGFNNWPDLVFDFRGSFAFGNGNGVHSSEEVDDNPDEPQSPQLVRPVVTAPANQTAVEDAAQVFDLGSFTAPFGSPWAVDINWGDNSTDSTFNVTVAGPLGSMSHTYGEEGTYQPMISVTNSTDNVAGTASFQVDVSDPAVIASGTTFKGIAGLPLTGVAVATFTDPGGAEPNSSDNTGTINDHYQVVSINWGDSTLLDTTSGVLSYAGSPGSTTDSFTVSGSHTYAQSGNFTITTIIKHEEAPNATATGTAAIAKNIGLLVLDPVGMGALTVSGDGPIVVNNHGAVIVNSNNAKAAIISDEPGVFASEIDVTGGTMTSGGGKFSTPVNHKLPTPDPIGLGLPTVPTPTFAAVNYSRSATLVLAPGLYVGGIKDSGSGNIVLSAGVYYLYGGGLQVSGSGSITGTGVLIVNASKTSSDVISVSGNGNVSLTAPAPSSLTGPYSPYAGITIMQTSTNPINISGNGGLTLDGTLYAPSAALRMTGNGSLTDYSDTNAPVARVIVLDVSVCGDGGLTIDADAPANNPPANTAIAGAAQVSFVSFHSSLNPAVPTQATTYTATLSATSGTPTGSVDFFDQTTHVDLGSVTLVGGVATLTTSALVTTGDHSITATYFADSPNFNPPAAPAVNVQHIYSEVVEGTTLFVAGNPTTKGINVSLKSNMVTVSLSDGSPTFSTPLAGLTMLVVYDQNLNDGTSISVGSSLMLPAVLYAGNGLGTYVQGGGGPTAEVGGSGGGTLIGGPGRSILIAGSGGGTLQGGAGGSILIGGSTDYDHNLAALEAALAEWNSSDNYATRLASSALAIFNASTVHSDGLADNLKGTSGTAALDWFFASGLDHLTNKNVLETDAAIV